MVTKHLESEISFEEVTISWSHGYAREEIPGKKVQHEERHRGRRAKDFPRKGDWFGMACQSTRSMRKCVGIKTSCREKKPAHVLKN